MELVVVVLILGILASVAIMMVVDQRDAVDVASIMRCLDVIQDQIDLHYQIDGTGRYPEMIQAAWFVGRKKPKHPQNHFRIAAIETVKLADAFHPTDKALKPGVGGAFWYNAAEGVVRARVAEQPSEQATLTLYNLVNGSDELNVGNYTGERFVGR